MKRGQYICPKCGSRFNWGYGFAETAPVIEDEDREEEICPPCNGLEFVDPMEILKDKPH